MNGLCNYVTINIFESFTLHNFLNLLGSLIMSCMKLFYHHHHHHHIVTISPAFFQGQIVKINLSSTRSLSRKLRSTHKCSPGVHRTTPLKRNGRYTSPGPGLNRQSTMPSTDELTSRATVFYTSIPSLLSLLLYDSSEC